MTTETDARPDILIVDDEVQIRSVVRLILEEQGFAVREAENGRLALGEAAIKRPDAIVLDLGLPDRPGHQVLSALRSFCASPVIILTVKDDEGTKVEMLDIGADDYLSKPFGSRELVARVRAIMRRPKASTIVPWIRFGPVEVDLLHRLVRSNGVPVYLTVTEFALLQLLSMTLGRVVTHREILRQIWGPKAENRTHYLRMYMMRLRRKLGEEIVAGGYLRTESGVGYRLVTTV